MADSAVKWLAGVVVGALLGSVLAVASVFGSKELLRDERCLSDARGHVILRDYGPIGNQIWSQVRIRPGPCPKEGAE